MRHKALQPQTEVLFSYLNGRIEQERSKLKPPNQDGFFLQSELNGPSTKKAQRKTLGLEKLRRGRDSNSWYGITRTSV